MEKEKRSGSIAIPFLVTLLITLLLVGGAALYFYLDYTKDDTVLQPMQPTGTLISEADRMTILCVLDTKEVDVPVTYMLVRFNPVRKKNVFLALPNSMQLKSGSTVDSVYAGGGVSSLKQALTDTLSLPVDHYMVFDGTGFQRFCDIIGGVETSVPVKIKGIPQGDQLQFLSGSQIQLLISHDYEGDEIQRSVVTSYTIASMFNQSDSQRLLQTLDSTVSTSLELANTDISALVYKEHKHALKYIVQFNPVCATYILPTATKDGSRYILTDGCKEKIAEQFS